MANNLLKVHEILFSKRMEMKEFMNFYVFKKKGISIENFVDDKEQFMEYIDFCLNTRMRIVNEDIKKGKGYFNKHYKTIHELIVRSNLDNLRVLVNTSPGIGQKIGSMLLEFIYLYSKYYNEKIINELYVPIDTHVQRIFLDSFNIKTPNIGYSYQNNKFIEFQNTLNQYSNNKGRIYFDYFWFIGKMFCPKIKDDKSRGYKLCKYCWIKEYCENEKWL